MFKKTKSVAMLLAGGQGSRLGVLTRDLAKPAVPYGGKYRIIDFPLSNCVNSGIETVGVLTQYQPLVLNDYIGTGQAWDLDRNHGGVHVLPPYQRIKNFDWYKGTANAIYQNIPFIERYSPDVVVILSGDHIYKMDYGEMIEEHEKKGADCTIAVLDVALEEASRFGIMNTREDGTIYEFEEKPVHPKSTKASMGIYVFSWDRLKYYLEQDEENPESSNDFGKDIIPKMLEDGQKMVAYPFVGYWKDVGTIDSLWEANMDLLDPNVPLNLWDRDWRIYARNNAAPPHFIAEKAVVQNSMVTEGCYLNGEVDFSVLFSEVTVEEGAVVRDSIIMPGATVKKGAIVQYAIVAEDSVIGENAMVGARPEDVENKDDWGVTVIGAGVKIGANAVVPPKAMISENLPEVKDNEM